MTPELALLALGFLLCAGLAWRIVEVIRELAPPDDKPRDPDDPIDYMDFKQ